MDYLSALGMENIHAYEQELVDYVCLNFRRLMVFWWSTVQKIPFACSVVAFNIDGLHPHDVATALDYEGVAVR